MDWVLACLAISKPRVILKRLLDSGFRVFNKSAEPDKKKAHLRSLTIILEYLIEKRPEIVADCLFNTLDLNSKVRFKDYLWSKRLTKKAQSLERPVGIFNYNLH